MEVKERILMKAADLFSRYGIRSITMDEIASQLGISKKTIYQFFTDKDDMVSAVIEQEIQRNEWNAATSASRRPTLSTRLFLALESLDEMLKYTNPLMLYDLEKHHPVAFQKLREYKYRFLYQILMDNLQWGISTGLYRRDLNRKISCQRPGSKRHSSCSTRRISPMAGITDLRSQLMNCNALPAFGRPTAGKTADRKYTPQNEPKNYLMNKKFKEGKRIAKLYGRNLPAVGLTAWVCSSNRQHANAAARVSPLFPRPGYRLRRQKQRHRQKRAARLPDPGTSNRATTSQALPQITGSLGFTQYTQVPVTPIPGGFFPGTQAGKVYTVAFALPYNASAGITLKQVLFDGQVFVGLQARKASLDFTRKGRK
jgi:AcrR family transcriptional regulator